MNVIAFPIAARRQPETFDRPATYDAMMVYRHGLGRPWLDMLAHDDQARIAGARMAQSAATHFEGK